LKYFTSQVLLTNSVVPDFSIKLSKSSFVFMEKEELEEIFFAE
jgi:hypothetical protein